MVFVSELSEDLDVKETLRAMAASGALGASERRARLLTYLLKEELAGRGDRISAYSIGVDVLGRPTDFDPNSDAIVRAEVGRLRKALEHYFATDGALDRTKIEIPPRSNRPVIIRKAETRSDGSPVFKWALRTAAVIAVLAVGVWQYAVQVPQGDQTTSVFVSPRIAVLEFQPIGEAQDAKIFAQGLRTDMVTELTRFDWLTVFVSDKANAQDLPSQVDYVLAADVRSDSEQLVTTMYLSRPSTGERLWSHVYQEDLKAAELIAMQQKAAAEIAVEIARPEGLIADLEKRRVLRDTTESDLAYSCIFILYEYWRSVTPENHVRLRDCVLEALKIAPDYAEAHAAMAAVYVEEARGLTIEASVDDPLDRAEFHMRKSLELSPDSTLAAQAAFEILALKGDLEEFRRIGEIAMRNSPNNPDILANFGLMMALRMGQIEEGVAFSNRALSLNPDPPLFYYYPMVLGAYMSGDIEMLRQFTVQASENRPILSAAVTLGLESRVGNWDEAEVSYSQLIPAVAPDLDSLLAIVGRGAGFHESVMSRLAEDFAQFSMNRVAN